MKPRIGDVLSVGVIPCRTCGLCHEEVVRQILPKLSVSWAMGGHTYEPMNALDFIQEQRSTIARLVKQVRKLKAEKRRPRR